MLCDSLDLGGVETHIVTLANALVARGHEVTLLSGGGRLCDALVGVKHITLPLFKKRALLSLFFTLWHLFRRERFDVIHAHTRFSAFLCRPIAKGRLVTTAHWVFDTRFPRGMLSHWGAATLAVSPDIEEYLQQSYRLPREKIYSTINGIDTTLFAPSEKNNSVPKIVCCTRMEPERDRSVFCLLEACDALADISFSLLILGGGSDLPLIEQKRNTLLKKHPHLDITLAGGVTDVAAHLRDADIFVGVSRAALEGMAAGCATVLAGNEGYLSVFSPNEAKAAEESNFCCRGASATTADALARDLRTLLSLPREKLHRMGEKCREYVVSRYSTRQMTEDALSVYQTICRKQVVLCGYYGARNIGDDLLCRAITQRLREMGYGQVLIFSRRHPSLRAVRALRRGYDLVLGGGNLLQDDTSRRSLGFYLWAARLAVGRIFIYGGIGPLSPRGEARASVLLSRATGVFCRTEGDLKAALRLGARKPKLSFDAVLALPLPKRKKGGKILLALRAAEEACAPAVFSFVFHLCRVFGKENIHLFPMHPKDIAFHKRISRVCSVPLCEGDADAFLAVLTECRAVFATRLHAGICALGMGIPFFLGESEEKCSFFLRDCQALAGEEHPCSTFSFQSRPTELPKPFGMEEIKSKFCRRI